MPRFMVDQELVLHVAVGVEVTATNKDVAQALVEEMMPNQNMDGNSKGWKAAIAIDKPKGVYVSKVVSYQTASGPGRTKVRKIGG